MSGLLEQSPMSVYSLQCDFQPQFLFQDSSKQAGLAVPGTCKLWHTHTAAQVSNRDRETPDPQHRFTVNTHHHNTAWKSLGTASQKHRS